MVVREATAARTPKSKPAAKGTRSRPGRRSPAGCLRSPKLVVVGQGYVGLPIAVRAAQRSFRVVGLETNAARVAAIASGHSGTADVPAAELVRELESGRYLPTLDPSACRGFDVAVIAVPTPLSAGDPDLSGLIGAAVTLAPFIERGSTVVLESTSYPGTTEEVVRPILERGSGLEAGPDFSLGFSPERIDPGNDRFPFSQIPKVVSGIDAHALDEVNEFYSHLVQRTVPVSSIRVAELTKLIENTFRHVNIAMVNELAMLARELDIDVHEALDAASTKPFGFMRFDPGPGVGGHCIPVDPRYLSWWVHRELGRRFRFVDLADDVNNEMPRYVLDRATEMLNDRGKSVNGSTVLLLGMAYKRNTGDDRESPAWSVARRLLARGATVQVHDAHIDPGHLGPDLEPVPLTTDVLHGADLVVLLADHDDVAYDEVVKEAAAVLDTRHRVSGPGVEQL